jgi:hypothetical protein
MSLAGTKIEDMVPKRRKLTAEEQAQWEKEGEEENRRLANDPEDHARMIKWLQEAEQIPDDEDD